jgi:quercetin dioxygenase-like cupin family protein
LGSLVTFKVRAPEYTVLEVATAPEKSPPPFVHHSQDALAFVLEGEYEIGGERLSAGSRIFIPRGRVHGMSVVGGEAGRRLVILTPSGPAERFFEEVGVPCVDGKPLVPPEGMPKMEQVSAIARRYGIEFLVTPV